jgi:hypothetical protein
VDDAQVINMLVAGEAAGGVAVQRCIACRIERSNPILHVLTFAERAKVYPRKSQPGW